MLLSFAACGACCTKRPMKEKNATCYAPKCAEFVNLYVKMPNKKWSNEYRSYVRKQDCRMMFV